MDPADPEAVHKGISVQGALMGKHDKMLGDAMTSESSESLLLVSWKKGDVWVFAQGCHCFSFLCCKVGWWSLVQESPTDTFSWSCSALATTKLLFLRPDSVTVMRSMIGIFGGQMAKSSLLAKTVLVEGEVLHPFILDAC